MKLSRGSSKTERRLLYIILSQLCSTNKERNKNE